MIENTKGAICDNCSNGIDYYQDITTKRLNEIIKEHGAIVKGRKHFCDEKCFNEFNERKVGGKRK
ncbi:hypothetical protein LCGC14_1402550 [marine sediment metagenome]|uniref:MYM-type domain-containing protein n=1 Tax=marine sediment metagenome TaxID=412755 RepID=A0A0F9JWV7_9ZZZZ